MKISIILAIIGVLVFVYLLIRVSKKQNAKNKEMLEKVAVEMGATLELGNWKVQPIISGELESTEYRVTFHIVSTGKTSITYLDLEVPCKSIENKIVLKKYGSGTKFFNKIGIGNRFESGDPAFDSEVTVRCKSEAVVRAVAYDSHFKNGATSLAGRGFVVEIKSPNAVASKIYKRKTDLHSAVLTADLKALIELVKTVEKY